MDAQIVSELLSQAHIWHKTRNNSIVTKRKTTPIPEINNKVAYLAGVITGDGSLNISKRSGYHYRIQIVGREGSLEHIVLLFKELFNYKSVVHRDERKANCYLINISSAAIFFYFIKLGFASGKKKNIKVPAAIAVNSSLFKHYLFGLIDTDGHISRNRIHLKQREETFLKELIYLLEKHFNIKSNPPKVNYTEGKPFYYIRFPLNNLQPDFKTLLG
jgi:intein/homing endonuclease